MIEFFTVMVLTYSYQGERLQSKILFPSLRACSAAMDAFHETLDINADGTMTQCRITDMASKSIRPQARPENWGKN